MALGVGERAANPPFINAAMIDSIYLLGAKRNSEKRIVLLIVNLQFPEFLQFGNLANRRMESQPMLATSYSQKNSNKPKSRMWPPVGSFGKVGLLRFYQNDWPIKNITKITGSLECQVASKNNSESFYLRSCLVVIEHNFLEKHIGC